MTNKYKTNDRVFVNSQGVPGTVLDCKHGEYRVKLDWAVPVVCTEAVKVHLHTLNFFPWELETL
jgi:hypothetical protein